MKAAARVVAEYTGGRTRLAVLKGEPPLLPRRTGTWSTTGAWSETGAAEVHLVGGAAGPLGGDVLDIDIEVGPGAHLVLRTVAASIVLPGQTGSMSVSRVTATVAPGGRLEWLPEPLVAVRGCRHLASSTVELAGDAELVWREELICGRHGEEGGDLTLETAVRLGGAPLLHQSLAVGPHTPGWAGPAVLGGFRATGSLLVVGSLPVVDSEPPPVIVAPSATAARMWLTPTAHLTTAVAPDAHHLRLILDSWLPDPVVRNPRSGSVFGVGAPRSGPVGQPL